MRPASSNAPRSALRNHAVPARLHRLDQAGPTFHVGIPAGVLVAIGHHDEDHLRRTFGAGARPAGKRFPACRRPGRRYRCVRSPAGHPRHVRRQYPPLSRQAVATTPGIPAGTCRAPSSRDRPRADGRDCGQSRGNGSRAADHRGTSEKAAHARDRAFRRAQPGHDVDAARPFRRPDTGSPRNPCPDDPASAR